MFFFCQAEDGIRDAQESRGLGDVYKRQPLLRAMATSGTRHARPPPALPAHVRGPAGRTHVPVSYTHLTLPTIYSV